MGIMLDEKWRKAQKTHYCNSCGVAIPRGEKYHWEKYVDSLGLYEVKSCEGCDKAYFDVAEYVDDWRVVEDEGITFDDYERWATDTDYEDTPAKQAWRERAGVVRYEDD